MEKEKIIKILEENNEGLKSQEIADKSRIDKKIVDKVLKALKDEDIIYSPKRCFYSLKKKKKKKGKNEEWSIFINRLVRRKSKWK